MKLLKWEDAQKEIKKGLVLLQFKTEWCGDCQMMKPIIEEVEKILSTKNIDINVIAVDAEESKLFRKEGAEFDVKKIPSTYVLKDGEKHHLGYEYISADKIVSDVEKYM